MKTIKYFGLTVFLLITALFVNASDANQWDDVIEQSYDVDNFSKVYIEGNFKVVLEQSNTPSVQIKADEEDFDYIEVDSFSDQLHISKKHFDFRSTTIYISFKDLEELYIEGGVTLETIGYIDLENFILKVEGGAKIEMGMKAEVLDVSGEGGVYFDLRGAANKMIATISGAGLLNAEEFRCDYVDVGIEGVGSASVYAVEKLNASIEGVGKISYKGNPEVEKSVEGIGNVNNK